MEKNSAVKERTMERISSPEQLFTYLRVAKPSMWITVAAVALLLLGAAVWGIWGRLETRLDTVAVAAQGQTVVFVSEESLASILDKPLTVSGRTFTITQDMVSQEPITVTAEVASEYAMRLGSLQTGQWVYTITFDSGLKDGVYQAQIITESVSPMSFVLN